MKFVFVLPGPGPSGGVRATVITANHLLDRGHNVRILYRKPKKTIRRIYKSIFSPIIHPGGYNWIKEFKGRLDSFVDITDCQFSKNEIIIGAGMWSSGQLTRLESISNPKLQYIHGEHIVNQKETEVALSSPLPKIVVSSFLKPLVESYGGNVLSIIPNGVNKQEYFNSANESGKDGIGAIYSSHISKDPETLLSVLEKLSIHKPEIPLRIFSQDNRPKQIAKSSFWRLPSVEKAREIYSKSLVWILTSRSEGFSIPVLEAMACGCAVVATNCGGPRDIIRDGENGFLVEVGNVSQIADRALQLINDSNLRERICIEAKKTVNEFTWENTIDKIEDILNNLAMTSEY